MKQKFLILLLAIAGLTWQAWTYTVSGTGTALNRWVNNTTITLVFNSTLEPGQPSELIRPTMIDAFSQWNDVLKATGSGVKFVDGGNVSSNNLACDQVNTVTFTATANPPLPSGVLAQAQTYFAPLTDSSGQKINYPTGLAGCGSTINAQFAGQILDADLVFNNQLVFVTNGIGTANGTNFDLEPVALHEAAHMLGLGHSALVNAIMSPFEGLGAARVLTTDDIAGMNAVYGTNAPGGALSGKIVDGTGAGVQGAHVVATDHNTGQFVASNLTLSDGSFTIVGLAPSSYDVLVEPLDGPLFLSSGSGYPDRFQPGRSDFSTVFSTSPVTVAAGQTASVNLTVGAKSMNLDGSMAVVETSGAGLSSSGAIHVKRGLTHEVCFGGTGLSGEITLSASSAKVSPTRASATCSALSSMRGRQFNFAADAPVGSYNVLLPAAALPGYLRITINPSFPSNGVVDAANNTTVVAGGSLISIYGSDLAPSVAAAASTPLPTQLNGVSVMIGDRFAPLIFVSPGQINAMVPYEVSGTVNVQIVSGQTTSASASITLASVGPRMFSITQDGKGQGAIQIANTTSFAAPAGSIPGASARPAVKGTDFLTIYCTGLGDVTNRLASGAAASGTSLSVVKTVPTVSIGGITAIPTFAGLSPGFVGLYQINVQVPVAVQSGNAVPVIITQGSATSNTVTIAVQ